MPQETQKFKQVASLVRSRRKSKKIALNKVSLSLKIPVATLEALESADNTEISDTHMSGLYRRYGKYLNIRESTLDRMLIEAESKAEIKRKKSKSTKTAFVLSNFASKIIVGAIVVAVLSYAVWLTYELSSAPNLVINSPSEYSVTYDPQVEIEGSADSDSTVLINGDPISVGADNKFSTNVYLQPGYNSIEITALNSFDRSKTLNRIIIFESN